MYNLANQGLCTNAPKALKIENESWPDTDIEWKAELASLDSVQIVHSIRCELLFTHHQKQGPLGSDRAP